MPSRPLSCRFVPRTAPILTLKWNNAPMSHRALDWLQRRASGEPLVDIAAHAGVSVEAIRRATDPYGPFPRTPKGALVRDFRATWIKLRQDGIAAAEIARRYGVSRQAVSRATQSHGPFPRPGTPTPESVAAWVDARRSGIPVTALAVAYSVSEYRIFSATRPHGPYPQPPPPAHPPPDGTLDLTRLTELLGVSFPTVITWIDKGYLPPPGVTTRTGRRLWLESTITAWLPRSSLRQCLTCGTYTRQMTRHSARHLL